jgi:formamidopyrimidine-DNA glycosylase
MPELPEVEVLVRHLAPLLKSRKVRGVEVRRPRIIAPTLARQLSRALEGATFQGVSRRGKYLLFDLRPAGRGDPFVVAGHLGMTGRMYLQPRKTPLPRHAAVVLDLGAHRLVFEDPRGFGRFTLDCAFLDQLGPEPLLVDFTPEAFHRALKRSSQPIKVKLLDQSLVAGIGNIYASEALFRAGVSPRLAARGLGRARARRLWQAIREELVEAIATGSTLPLNFAAGGSRDRLFYYGTAGEGPYFHTERLRVYDRAGQPCLACGASIKRLVQAARSTFYCPVCQRG